MLSFILLYQFIQNTCCFDITEGKNKNKSIKDRVKIIIFYFRFNLSYSNRIIEDVGSKKKHKFWNQINNKK